VALLKIKIKVSVVSEKVRNANENEYLTSKMATGGHLKKIQNGFRRKNGERQVPWSFYYF
jgi:hypothetical protein